MGQGPSANPRGLSENTSLDKSEPISDQVFRNLYYLFTPTPIAYHL